MFQLFLPYFAGFFQNYEFFRFFCPENFKWYSGEDLRVIRVRACVRIPRNNCFFIFQPENIFRSNLNFSTFVPPCPDPVDIAYVQTG